MLPPHGAVIQGKKPKKAKKGKTRKKDTTSCVALRLSAGASRENQ